MDFFWLLVVFFFVFGTFIGSFLNVLILRTGTGVSISGRSFCFSCGRKIPWYDLFPVVSFFLLGGNCRRCASKISIQYPLVELCAGILFAGAFWKLFEGAISLQFLTLLPLHFIAVSFLLALSVYDFRHKIIPDNFVWPFIAVGFLVALLRFIPSSHDFPHLLDLLGGPILFLLFAGLWFFSKGRWMGFGDAKLVLGMGLFLGLVKGLSGVVLGFWIGALWALGVLIVSKWGILSSLRRGGRELTMKAQVPFAPFLVLGFLAAYFWNVDLFSLHVFLNL